MAPQRPRRPSDGGDDEMATAESERILVFGLEARGAAAAFQHAAGIDAARVKEVGVLEHPDRFPMDPLGEALMRCVAHRVAVPSDSDRPRCKPRGGRTITVTENAGVVIELDWDNLAGIFPDRAIPVAPRKRTAPRPFFRPLFRSGDANLATTSKIADDTKCTKSESETPGGRDEFGPTTVYDCAIASEEIRGEDGRPPADREARVRGSIAAGSSRRTKHSRLRMRRSSYSGTSNLSCEHVDRCSPEATLRFQADDGDASFFFSDDEQDAAGNPEPPGDVSVVRAYDALVGRRWDQLRQVPLGPDDV